MLDGPEGFSGPNDEFGNETDWFADIDNLKTVEGGPDSAGPMEPPEQQTKRLQQEQRDQAAAEARIHERLRRSDARKVAEQQQQVTDHERADTLFEDVNPVTGTPQTESEEDLLAALPEDESTVPTLTPEMASELSVSASLPPSAPPDDAVAAILAGMDNGHPSAIDQHEDKIDALLEEVDQNNEQLFSSESNQKQLDVYKKSVKASRRAVSSSVAGSLKILPSFIATTPDAQAEIDDQIDEATTPENLKRHTKDVQRYQALPDGDPHKERLRNTYKKKLAKLYFEGNKDRAESYVTLLESTKVQQQVRQFQDDDLLYSTAQVDLDKAESIRLLLEAGDDESLAEAREILTTIEGGEELLAEFDHIQTVMPFSDVEIQNILDDEVVLPPELDLSDEEGEVASDAISDLAPEQLRYLHTTRHGDTLHLQFPASDTPVIISLSGAEKPRMGIFTLPTLDSTHVKAAAVLIFLIPHSDYVQREDPEVLMNVFSKLLILPDIAEPLVNEDNYANSYLMRQVLDISGSLSAVRRRLAEIGLYSNKGYNYGRAFVLGNRIRRLAGEDGEQVTQLSFDDLKG